MKKIILLLLLFFPVSLFAQELIGKKKKYINSVKQNSALLIDLPEMSVWNNKAEAGSLYLICYYKEDRCEKTVSIYTEDKLNQWHKILNANCNKVAGNDPVWVDPKRQLKFRILPGDNKTFGVETVKANE